MVDEVRSPTPREFYRTLKERWFIAMAGTIGVLAWIATVVFPKVGAVQIILIASMTAVILSAYHIWAQERAKLVAALRRLAEANERLQGDLNFRGHGNASAVADRDDLIILLGELRGYLTARAADYNAEFHITTFTRFLETQEAMLAMDGQSESERRRIAKQQAHNEHAIRTYGERFARRVLSINRKLIELGADPAAIEHLGKYPTTIADIEAIAGELEAASTVALKVGNPPEQPSASRQLELDESDHVPEPNVVLEFTSPGPFYLANDGATACEIHISPVVDSLFTVTFPIIGDLHAERKQIAATIAENVSLGFDPPSIMDFLAQAARHRAMDIQEEKDGTVNGLVSETLIEGMSEPLEFKIELIYTNSGGSRRHWSKIETLLYDARTKQAYVKHGFPVELP